MRHGIRSTSNDDYIVIFNLDNILRRHTRGMVDWYLGLHKLCSTSEY